MQNANVTFQKYANFERISVARCLLLCIYMHIKECKSNQLNGYKKNLKLMIIRVGGECVRKRQTDNIFAALNLFKFPAPPACREIMAWPWLPNDMSWIQFTVAATKWLGPICVQYVWEGRSCFSGSGDLRRLDTSPTFASLVPSGTAVRMLSGRNAIRAYF
jgi:hypothetical protein